MHKTFCGTHKHRARRVVEMHRIKFNLNEIKQQEKIIMKEKISYQIIQKNLTLKALTLIQEKDSD